MNENARHIWIIGHRGGAGGDLPENSLAAIKYGLEQHCDIIEIDVQQTADSVVVVNHDKTINRTTDGKGYIRNLTFKDLQQFTIESKTGKSDPGEKIPSLEQVIRLINGKSKLLIEIKSGNRYYPGIEQRVLEIIHRNGAEDWCIIQSFNMGILKTVHTLDSKMELYKVCLGKLPLVPVWISNKIEIRRIEKFDFITGVTINYRFMCAGIVNLIHQSGKQVIAWTVDDRKAINKVVGKGVDGIITNYPDLMSGK